MAPDGLRARHDRILGDATPLFYDEPLELTEGDGVWLHTADGGRYLDVYNNVPCVGHGNTRVAEAMYQQARTLNVHSRYLHQGVIEYGERLLGLHHDQFESVVFACSGSEAIEIALMMARGATGGRGIIGTDATYHGNTEEVSKLTRLSSVNASSPHPEFRSIPTPQLFRPLAPGLTDTELTALYLSELETQIAAFEADGVGFAGMIACSIMANEGLPRIPAGFMEGAVELVHEAGGLFIADEVQAGFARSGRWWGYQTSGFEPDIVAMGKPMGNGLPVSGVTASHELVSGFRRTRRYFNTYAGSPLQAAAGNAVLEEIESGDLVSQVSRVGAHLRAGLDALEHPALADVRGHGLFIGVEWVTDPDSNTPDPDGAARVVEAMRQRGILMGQAGQHRNVLKVRPPLVFNDEHADLFLDAFSDAIDAVPATSVRA
ncbi:MAG: aminotransferase class III-fold pyridoxal phosphate-dependent enzyme [Actinomycetia bacterium]|nr:aminotransferase class III-fold pyridoxal phosphate-dependent enzyme [Actinomycetes bacterium]